MGKASEMSILYKEIKQKMGKLISYCYEIEGKAEDSDAAYAHGYSDAKAESYDEKDKIYDEARGRGYKEGQARGYQEGLFDAWEVARKIWEYDIGTLHEIYDPIGMRVDCFTKFTASEAIAKIAEYEKTKEESIKVGDEVISEDATKAVVLDMEEYVLHVLTENGAMEGWPREDVAKTDRHFPEIAEVLRKMGEVQ